MKTGIRARRRLRAMAGPAPSTPVDRPAGRAGARGGRGRRISVVVIVGGLGVLVGGPVAGAVGVAYTVIGFVGLAARRREMAASAALDAILDVLIRLAAELRAGADPGVIVGSAVAPFAGEDDAGRLARRVSAAVRVADSTGAPLADLLDRLDDDARSLRRCRRTATAQASGALATALLLAALPLAGIGLGYAIGVNPGNVLLHTPLGAACAAGAVTAQVAGLAWSWRITRAIGRAA